MIFAIKTEISDLRAKTFAFNAQKTMYGGKHIAKGDTIFIFASDNGPEPPLRSVENYVGEQRPLPELTWFPAIVLSVVLSLVRNAIGAPDAPSGLVITGLSLVLTFFVMAPVAIDMVRAAAPTATSPAPTTPGRTRWFSDVFFCSVSCKSKKLEEMAGLKSIGLNGPISLPSSSLLWKGTPLAHGIHVLFSRS